MVLPRAASQGASSRNVHEDHQSSEVPKASALANDPAYDQLEKRNAA
jgi:hypothetical protein